MVKIVRDISAIRYTSETLVVTRELSLSLIHSRHFFCWLTVLFVLASPAAASEWHFEGVNRIVALSDIHGAYAPMVRTLRNAGILDAELSWSGGSAHLVIVGDILDRGPESRKAMDLLMRIETEAASAGGRVHVLIGNHEAMNLVGDLRYVSKSEYAAFAAEENAAEREHWFKEFTRLRRPDGKELEELRQIFEQSFPAGFFAHRRAFSTDGKYGRWLLEKPVMIVIDGTAFVHGGVSPMIGELGLEGVNDRLRSEMVRYVGELEVLYEASALLPTDNFYQHPALLQQFTAPLDADENLLRSIENVKTLNESDIHGIDGPLWYRGNVSCSALIEADRLDAALASIGARRVVIGHTPTNGRQILERFDGTVIEVDTGMLNSYYRGSGNAVVIEGDRVSAVNETGARSLALVPHPRRVGQRPAVNLLATDIEKLLEQGEIISTAEDDAGNEIVTVSDGVNKLEAVFTKRSARGFFPEAAAYRLDLLLGLDMVPVAVTRRVGRNEGTLRFRVPGSIDEPQRQERGLGAAAQCPLPDQWYAMPVFDALIYNEGRTLQNLRYSPDKWQLLLIGHERAFSTSKGRPAHLRDRELLLTARWRKALESLTDEILTERLGDVLDKKRIAALGKRRDELLSQ